jgi:hypothetical protein
MTTQPFSATRKRIVAVLPSARDENTLAVCAVEAA